MRNLSQSIPWDPNRFVGFSADQLEMIRKGFFAALDGVYRLERRDDGLPDPNEIDEVLVKEWEEL